ncbi:MAG: S8 family serine peptidase [Candidatus Zixiibacteriota bacterium]|nr:MAG: S8 family serine peptidase [candidate division Zixibacteria bacterium]
MITEHIRWTLARAVWTGITVFVILLVGNGLVRADDNNGLSRDKTGTDDLEAPRAVFTAEQVVVKFTSDTVSWAEFSDSINADVSRQLSHSGAFLFQLGPDDNPEEFAEELNQVGKVEYAHPNYLVDDLHPVQGSYPFSDVAGTGSFDDQPAVSTVDLTSAQDLASGSGVTVAVIDGGIDIFHPELSGIATYGYDYVDGDDAPFDEPGGQCSGHGTFVAGVIHLGAPDAEIRAYRVIDAEGIGDGFTLAIAIENAVDDGCDIINLSLVLMAEHMAVKDAIAYAASQGVPVICAAGNEGTSLPVYPGAWDLPITVGAVDTAQLLADFSTYGNQIDVCAPGTDIYSTYQDDGFAWWSGTSFATPFVTAQAALLREVRPTASSQDLITAISLTAADLDENNPDYQGQLGNGLVDFYLSIGFMNTLETAWVVPDTLFMEFMEGVQALVVPEAWVHIYSSNAPAMYVPQVLPGDPTFVWTDSLTGFTDDSVLLYISPSPGPVGTYYNTVRFDVDGVPVPTDLTVCVTVIPNPDTTYHAFVAPNVLNFRAPAYSEMALTETAVLYSSNAPASYLGYRLEPRNDFLYLQDSTGYLFDSLTGITVDSITVMVLPSLAAGPGFYTDSVVFEVDGVEQPPLLVINVELTDPNGPTACCDEPGDVNRNGVAYEIADRETLAVALFYGDSTYLPCIGNADVVRDCLINNDDLVYMQAVIQGDTVPPIPECGLCTEYLFLPNGDSAWIYHDTDFVYVVDEGSTEAVFGSVFVTSSNAPANFIVEVVGPPHFITLLEDHGITNDSLRFQVSANGSPAGWYVETLRFMVEGAVNNPVYVDVPILVQPTGPVPDSAHVQPTSVYFNATAGSSFEQYDDVYLTSSNAPAFYTAYVLSSAGIVTIQDSAGMTNDSVAYVVRSDSTFEPGIYVDTIAFEVEGVVNSPVHLEVYLTIDTVGGATCCGFPGDVDGNGILYEASDANLLVSALTTGDTAYLPCIGNADIDGDCRIDLSDLIILQAVINGDSLPYPTECGGCRSYELIPDSSGQGTAIVWPYSQVYEVPADSPFTFSGGVYLTCSGGPTNYTVGFLDSPDFTTLLNNAGITDDSILFTVGSDTGLDSGLYADTLMIVVQDAANSPVYGIVYVDVGGAGSGLGVATAWPVSQAFEAPSDSQLVQPGSVYLTCTKEPHDFTVGIRDEADFLVLLDFSGTTDDSVNFTVNGGLGMTPGLYVDTLQFDVPNASNTPVFSVVYLTVTEPVNPSDDSAWVDPSFVQSNFMSIHDPLDTVGVFLSSTNAPAMYSGYVIGGPTSFVSLPDSVGFTNDSVFLVFDPWNYMAGTHYDSILFDISGIDNPVILLVSMYVAMDSMPALTLTAYPNPFNPAVNIMFDLPVASEVRLQIFNVVGRMVSTLVDGELGAGRHSVAWDGSTYASGIYFYRLETNEAVLTRKMVLLK